LDTFESKFKPFERDTKHSNVNSNNSIGIRSIRIQIRTIGTSFEALECKLETFKRDSKHSNTNSNYSKRIRNIGSIQKGFECKF